MPGIDEAWSATTVVMFSDLQVGMWFDNAGMIERVVARALEADADLVLLGGDFLYSADHAVGEADEITAARQSRDVEVLQNDVASVPLATNGGADPLHVVGLGAARPGLDDVDQALSEIPEDAPRLVPMHNPTSFPELPADTAPFALAGHIHCGQIALPTGPTCD